MAIETGLAMFTGTDRRFIFHVVNEEQTAAVNIADWTLSFQVKAAIGDTSPLLSKTTSAGIAISGSYNSAPASNTQRATVTLDAADTENFEDGVTFWELRRTNTGFNNPVAYGLLEFKQNVHHP